MKFVAVVLHVKGGRDGYKRMFELRPEIMKLRENGGEVKRDLIIVVGMGKISLFDFCLPEANEEVNAFAINGDLNVVIFFRN